MKLIFKCFLLLFAIIPALSNTNLLIAQEGLKYDSLDRARELAYSGEFQNAIRILDEIHRNEQNPEALHLHAQILYWTESRAEAVSMFRQAISADPDNFELVKEAGVIFFDYGRLILSRNLLRRYESYDASDADVQYLLAWLDFWDGKSVKAKKRISDFLEIYPENSDAQSLLNTIKQTTSPVISSETKFQSGVDYMDTMNLTAGLEWYHSRLLSLSAVIDARQFEFNESRYNSIWLHGVNTFSTGLSGFSLTTGAGFFGRSVNANSEITWQLRASQRFLNDLTFEGFYAREPYQHTTFSIMSEDAVMFKEYGVSLNYNHNDRYLGKAVVHENKFEGAGKVRNIYAWMVIPLFTLGSADLSAGYAISYSDADRSTFNPLFTPDGTILTDDVGNVKGAYDPYYSPLEQFIQRGIIILGIQPSSRLNFSFSFKYGFMASGQTPFLFTNLNDSGEVVVERGYLKSDFNPIDVEGEVRFRVSPLFMINAEYAYRELFFYSSHYGGIKLSYQFPAR